MRRLLPRPPPCRAADPYRAAHKVAASGNADAQFQPQSKSPFRRGNPNPATISRRPKAFHPPPERSYPGFLIIICQPSQGGEGKRHITSGIGDGEVVESLRPTRNCCWIGIP